MKLLKLVSMKKAIGWALLVLIIIMAQTGCTMIIGWWCLPITLLILTAAFGVTYLITWLLTDNER